MGLSVGDVVTYTAAGTALTGLTSGTSYLVGTVANANTFYTFETTSAAVTLDTVEVRCNRCRW